MSSPSKTSRQAFHIRELCCVDEMSSLRGELEGRSGVQQLDFDLLNSRMTVEYDPELLSSEQIVQRVASLGMSARPWAKANQDDGDDSFWARRGRAILTSAAGAFTAAGFAAHWITTGSIAAALGAHFVQSTTAIPPVAVACYGVSIACGLWFVAPKAFWAARRLRADMNLLMCIAVAGAIVLGEWFEAASVSFLFAVALLLETWSTSRARQAIKALVEVSPQTARLFVDGDERETPVEQVAVGAEVVVRPGEKIPLDGRVTSGASAVNQAPITGESAPIAKSLGDEVFAGSINGDGLLRITVAKPASDTTLARIIRMVEEAQSRRAPSEQWVERFAQYYTPAVMALAALVAVAPPLAWSAAWSDSIYSALVLLVIACPCALVISTPVSVVSALASAARRGVLIKGGRYLEACARLRAIALDKTGTLTYGRPVVEEIIPLNGSNQRELLSAAAGLESNNPHPYARAILQRAAQENAAPLHLSDFRITAGRGAEGEIDGRRLWIGGRRFGEEKTTIDGKAQQACEELEGRGRSVVVVGEARQILGLIGVADQVREGASAAVRELRALGIEQVCMLTGDHQRAAGAVARQTEIDDFVADSLPEDKVRQVEALRERYGYVAMIGDGVNDSPAMAAATVGMAMGAIGSDAAIETADIALMADDLSKAPWLIQHARRALSIIRQNIAFALGLKLLFVLLALLGVASLWMAIAADMGASLLVIFNALRLLR